VHAIAAEHGFTMPSVLRLLELRDRAPSAYAERLGAQSADVSLTTATTEGAAPVLGGLDLGAPGRGDRQRRGAPRRAGPAAGFAERAAQRGVIVRDVPGWGYVRASVGPCNNEDDLQRLLELAT
jgi:hypothetical protein